MRFVDGYVSLQIRLTLFLCDLAVCYARFTAFHWEDARILRPKPRRRKTFY